MQKDFMFQEGSRSDLFHKRGKTRILMESYPSGQRVNARLAVKMFGLHTEEIAVGNGAVEIISAYMRVIGGKIGFVYPTFEEYPNRIDEDRRVVFTPSAENGFRYTASDLIAFLQRIQSPISSSSIPIIRQETSSRSRMSRRFAPGQPNRAFAS